MADRFPLIVNASSRKIEELVAGDNLDLTGNGVIIGGDIGDGKYLKSDGGFVVWDSPGDVYLTQTQTLTNKTLESSILSGSLNTFSNIPNSALVNTGITINNQTVALGGTITTPDTNTTYTIGVSDGNIAAQKIVTLSGSDSLTDSFTIAVGSPASVPAGQNAVSLALERSGDTITLSGTVVDNNTITTLQADSNGTPQTGAMRISGSGGVTITQDTGTKTIDVFSRNDDTITRLRGGVGQVYADGDFTILGGTEVTISQAPNGVTGDPEITINSSDTVTRVKGGSLGTLTSGDLTITGGAGGNVTVSQSGSTINIDSENDDTITELGANNNSLASGKFKLQQAGATTLTQSYDAASGITTISISSDNDDTGASLSAGDGLSLAASVFSLKNSGNLIDNRISKWDGANGQFTNGIITDDGSTITINGDLNVLGTNTILETSTLIVEDNTIELRKGASLTGSDGGIQVNRTTQSDGVVTSFNILQWYEAGAYWRSYDGSVAKRFVTETDTQTLTNKTLTSPTMTNPTLGAATATTYNGLNIATTSASTFELVNLKTFKVDNTLTLKGDDGITIDFDNGGGINAKVAYNTFHLGQFSTTTSSQLSGKISDSTGAGSLVFAQNPVFSNSINSQDSTFSIVDSSVGTVNFAGAATAINIGSTSGTTTIAHGLTVDGNVILTDQVGRTLLVNGVANFDLADIQIRGTNATPIYIGRGGGEVATNTRVGYSALQSNQSGFQNTAMGHSALVTCDDGNENTAFGYNTLRDLVDGSMNVAIGSLASAELESGDGNVVVGQGAGQNNVAGDYNVCLGHYAGHSVSGSGNVLIGAASTENTLSPTFAPPAAGGDNQLVIGSGAGVWIRGDSAYNVRLENDLRVEGEVRIDGNLVVEGSTVSITSSTITVDDKNIELAAVTNTTFSADVTNGSANLTNVAVLGLADSANPTAGLIIGMTVNSPGGAVPAGTVITALDPAAQTITLSNAVTTISASEQFVAEGPTDSAADGGGMIIKGTPILNGGTGDKTFLYDHSRVEKYFVSTESIELANNRRFSIANQLVLDQTTLGSTVVNSSLTSVGVLTGPTGLPALETDGAVVFGGRVIEEAFSNMSQEFSISAGTASIITAAANTICGKTTATNSAIQTWAFSTADPDGNTLQNGQTMTVTLIIDASPASTYGDGCTIDGTSVTNGVRWSGGSPPISTSNTDILTFLIVKDSSGNTRVYGQGNTDFS